MDESAQRLEQRLVVPLARLVSPSQVPRLWRATPGSLHLSTSQKSPSLQRCARESLIIAIASTRTLVLSHYIYAYIVIQLDLTCTKCFCSDACLHSGWKSAGSLIAQHSECNFAGSHRIQLRWFTNYNGNNMLTSTYVLSVKKSEANHMTVNDKMLLRDSA